MSKKNNKKKGDILEYLISILEKAVQDNPTTKIYPKHKVQDRDGVVRELDLYFEVVVNNKFFKYAFECKNYKNGVSLQHITDFYSKIEATGLDGYFVTTSNYQSGAIKKAAALKIELLTLRKRPVDKNDIKGILLMRKKFEITNIAVQGTKSTEEVDMNDVLTSCENCKRALSRLIERKIIPTFLNHAENGVETIEPDFKDFRKIGKLVGRKNARSVGFYVVLGNTSITHKGVQIPINVILIEVNVWLERFKEVPLNIETFSYCIDKKSNKEINFSFSQFLFEGENVFVSISKIGENTVGTLSTKLDIEKTEMFNLYEIGKLEDIFNSEADDENHELPL